MEEKIFNVSDLRSRIETSVFYGDIQWGDKVKLIFPFKDPNSYCDIPTNELKGLVEDIEGSCICTKDAVYIRDSFVEVTFDASKVQRYDHKIPYETSIKVRWRDGVPLKKVNEFGQMVDNLDKATTYLSLYGSILPK